MNQTFTILFTASTGSNHCCLSSLFTARAEESISLAPILSDAWHIDLLPPRSTTRIRSQGVILLVEFCLLSTSRVTDCPGHLRSLFVRVVSISIAPRRYDPTRWWNMSSLHRRMFSLHGAARITPRKLHFMSWCILQLLGGPTVSLQATSVHHRHVFGEALGVRKEQAAFRTWKELYHTCTENTF